MPGGYKNIKPRDNTGGFHKNPNNINKKGRPLKIYTILKDKGYSSEDIKASFGELAFYSINELKKIKDDKEKPIIVKIVANQFITAFEQNNWVKIKEILDHVLGRPNQTVDNKIDLTSNDLNISVYSEKGSENLKKLKNKLNEYD